MAKRKPASPSSETTVSAAGSSYTVLARRYRPQQFADLVGQEHVAQALAHALQTNRVAHAYLFTGSRGVGKTSTARILAKALNCESGPTATPCDQCEICTSIAGGDDIDVLEIDAASNRGIDEIRDLRQNVQYRPGRARYKIYIIDEVHMLTREAFNALLKTLEEPPQHVKFIFATTEIQKIPITILSRCQRFDFAGINIKDIVGQLKRIVISEGMEAEEEALELVARRATGSMRDAESLLDQLLAFTEKKLTVEQVHDLLGTAHDDRVIALANAVLAQDGKGALELLAKAADEGLDLSELLNQLIDYWRDLMVVHCAGIEGQAVSVTGAHREALQQQAKETPLDSLLAGLDVLVSTKSKMARGNQHGRVLVEMALVRLSRLGDLVALSQLAQWLQDPKVAPASRPATANQAAPSHSTGTASSAGSDRTTGKKNGTPAAERHQAGTPRELTQETLPQIWAEALDHLSGLLAHQLRKQASVAISGPNNLVIQIAAQYNALCEQLQDAGRVSQIEKALQTVTGQLCHVRIESINDQTHPQPAGDSTVQPDVLRPRLQTPRGAEVPLVRKALDILGAQIFREDPGFGGGEEETSSLPTSAEPQED